MNISLNLGKNALESPSLTAIFFHLGGLLTTRIAAPAVKVLFPRSQPCPHHLFPLPAEQHQAGGLQRNQEFQSVIPNRWQL